MAPKRRRDSEDTNGDDGRTEEMSSTAQPHDELWFGDGSIVLATDVHLYRVHKSMLAKYSTVLSDMFEIPSGGANMECWEGVPIVKMVGDSDEEVCALLKALYDRKFQNTLESTDLCVISSLLSVARKYDFSDIRADVLQYLESLFPSTYEEYKTSKVHTLPITDAQMFTLLGVAYRCEALSILPALYYRCAILSVQGTIDFIYALPEECARKLLVGREWLSGNSQLLNLRTLASPQCCIHRIRPIALNYIKPTDLSFKFALDLPERGLLEGLDNVCKSCEIQYMQLLGSTREFLWKNMAPKFLGKTWEQII